MNKMNAAKDGKAFEVGLKQARDAVGKLAKMTGAAAKENGELKGAANDFAGLSGSLKETSRAFAKMRTFKNVTPQESFDGVYERDTFVKSTGLQPEIVTHTFAENINHQWADLDDKTRTKIEDDWKTNNPNDAQDGNLFTPLSYNAFELTDSNGVTTDYNNYGKKNYLLMDGGGAFTNLYLSFNSDGCCDIDHAVVQKEAQGAGLNKAAMQSILDMRADQPPQKKLKEVTLSANVSVGGYAWAKVGFKPANTNSCRDMLGTISKTLKDVLNNKTLTSQMNDGQALALQEYKNEVDRALKDLTQNGSKNDQLFKKYAPLVTSAAQLKQPVAPKAAEEYLRDIGGRETDKYTRMNFDNFTVGKLCMMGTAWGGALDLTQDADRQALKKYAQK
ncbi:hypothetical protein JM93_01632 [Roseibium hamelinense]|uniref:Uncharacterized protein n=1 Tax=Roseibium hamelinense TaxID=150831 RepID=A0A562T771_9HYPH|nr:hypothetical protein JM93_01632 [Roseibium hamelinense]